MRRPAQHILGPTTTGWAHPYAGVLAAAVFYNDGGQPAAQQVPTPADLAQRAAAQPPAAPAQTPAPPAAPAAAPGDAPVLLDHRTGEPMTQAAFTRIMAREGAKGRRAALREIAEKAGITLSGNLSDDPSDADVERITQVLKDAETARQARLSEDERRVEELTAREQALADREAKAQQAEADAAARTRATQIRAALVSLGATGDDLEDAAALLRVADDADEAAIQQAAKELKERRGILFGGTATPQTLPAAPSGGPAGGNAPRTPAPGKDAIKEAARQMAIDRGLRKPDAA